MELQKVVEAQGARIEALEAKGAAAESTGVSCGGERRVKSASQKPMRATQKLLVLARLRELAGDKPGATVAVSGLNKDPKIGGIITKGHASSTRDLRNAKLIEFVPGSDDNLLRITAAGWAAPLWSGVPAAEGAGAD